MFEVGAQYQFTMLEAGDDITITGVVETYEHPLIKLEDVTIVLEVGGTETSTTYPGQIINVTSTNFIRAVKLP